jgi:dihydrofolate synthase/folylpolyglutamate synthase
LANDLLVDGAHNPDGANSLAAFLSSLSRDRRRVLLLGGGKDKDIRSVAAALAGQFDRIYTTAGNHPNARSPWEVAAELEGLPTPVTPAGMLADALPACRDGKTLVVAAGSLYMVGAVRDLVGAAPG